MAEWRYRIWEFTNADGKSVLHTWMNDLRLTSRHKVQLVQKMDVLAQSGSTLAPGLLDGPVPSVRNPRIQSHTYKLIVRSDRQLRPFFCRGPFDMENEFTFLLGAIEVGDELDSDIEDAEQNRAIIIADPSRRVRNGRYR